MVQFNYFPLVLTFIAHTDANTGQSYNNVCSTGVRVILELTHSHIPVYVYIGASSWNEPHASELNYISYCGTRHMEQKCNAHLLYLGINQNAVICSVDSHLVHSCVFLLNTIAKSWKEPQSSRSFVGWTQLPPCITIWSQQCLLWLSCHLVCASYKWDDNCMSVACCCHAPSHCFLVHTRFQDGTSPFCSTPSFRCLWVALGLFCDVCSFGTYKFTL